MRLPFREEVLVPNVYLGFCSQSHYGCSYGLVFTVRSLAFSAHFLPRWAIWVRNFLNWNGWQAVVLFFSQLGWALYGVSLVVSGFECGIEYISGRGNIQQAALNAIKGFLAVNLFTVVPVRLYSLSVALQGTFAQGIPEPVQALEILARQFWKPWSLLP